MTPGQIKYCRGLLLRNGLHDSKDDVVLEYTNGRTTHLSDMTHLETQALIASMLEMLGAATATKRLNMVNKMLSQCHEMGWELPDGKVDMKHLNDWMVKYSPVHKKLDDKSITDAEMAKVVTVFDRVYLSFMQSV